ncbi:hypothetical protein JG688_00003351 [Phytophthora aleatoria]|uniref:Uncharacterized protein n=1 Tax=Phytophthora aleatoria TaxID=2496075 RepID=A0A8J5ITK1_9STRA|nr:hypothetical protein JG688_00003351 [Phytophthora aleatoria]
MFLMARRLSTKLSRPLQHAKKVTNEPKTATSQQDTTAKPAEDTETNPWSHFAAFNSMEDYVDVTLIQYNKQEDDQDKKP